MLSCEAIDQYYGGSHILWDLSLAVPAGSVTCVMGRNGTGKTTLMNTLMGLLPPAAGRIFFDGSAVHAEPAEWRARHGIGYVPQGRQIFPRLSVHENLRTALPARGGGSVPSRVFDLFPVLADMADRRGGDLSGGQQQQLAIARALVLEPRLLILDEPCEGIQPNVVDRIGDVLLELNGSDGVTILLVEQKLPFARRLADRFVILDRGRDVAEGAMDELDDELIARHLTV